MRKDDWIGIPPGSMETPTVTMVLSASVESAPTFQQAFTATTSASFSPPVSGGPEGAVPVPAAGSSDASPDSASASASATASSAGPSGAVPPGSMETPTVTMVLSASVESAPTFQQAFTATTSASFSPPVSGGPEGAVPVPAAGSSDASPDSASASASATASSAGASGAVSA